MIYLQLFLAFLQVGAFSFGGGYAALPLIQNLVVNQNHWIAMDTFTDLITISQMTPGPIIINAATFVGMQKAGILGAIAATAGSIFPNCVIITLLAILYKKYQNLKVMNDILGFLRPAVVALIAGAGIDILFSALIVLQAEADLLHRVRWDLTALFIAALVLLRWTKKNPVLIMLGCGIVNVFIAFVMNR